MFNDKFSMVKALRQKEENLFSYFQEQESIFKLYLSLQCAPPILTLNQPTLSLWGLGYLSR